MFLLFPIQFSYLFLRPSVNFPKSSEIHYLILWQNFVCLLWLWLQCGVIEWILWKQYNDIQIYLKSYFCFHRQFLLKPRVRYWIRKLNLLISALIIYPAQKITINNWKYGFAKIGYYFTPFYDDVAVSFHVTI